MQLLLLLKMIVISKHDLCRNIEYDILRSYLRDRIIKVQNINIVDKKSDDIFKINHKFRYLETVTLDKCDNSACSSRSPEEIYHFYFDYSSGYFYIKCFHWNDHGFRFSDQFELETLKYNEYIVNSAHYYVGSYARSILQIYICRFQIQFSDAILSELIPINIHEIIIDYLRFRDYENEEKSKNFFDTRSYRYQQPEYSFYSTRDLDFESVFGKYHNKDPSKNVVDTKK